MQFSSVLALAFATATFAAPTVIERDLTYGPGNHVIDSVCPAPHGDKPLGPLFPYSNMLGAFIGPVVKGLIGAEAEEDIDNAADALCVGTGEDNGVCQDLAAAVRDFLDAKTPLTQSKQYGCLLDYLCVAHKTPQNEGTCNFLLAGADCNANRLIQTKNLECTS